MEDDKMREAPLSELILAFILGIGLCVAEVYLLKFAFNSIIAEYFDIKTLTTAASTGIIVIWMFFQKINKKGREKDIDKIYDRMFRIIEKYIVIFIIVLIVKQFISF